MPDPPDHPYRPSPSESEADAELRRMAADGQERILAETTSRAAAAQKADEETRDDCLRVALGLHYGPHVRPGPVAVLCVAVLLELAVLEYLPIGHMPGALLLVLGIWLAVGAVIATLSPPVATRARVAAERAWATSLPFAMDGYFEVLAATPSAGCRLVVSLQWADAGSAPRPEIVQGTLGVLDARGQAAPCEDASVSLRSGPISCNMWRSGRGAAPTYFNHRLVAYMHRLVDKVLLPLHRSHPISMVSVSREGLTSSDEIREVLGLPPDR